jgi:hypothetical protein
MIQKILGLIFFAFLILIIINAKSVLTSIARFVNTTNGGKGASSLVSDTERIGSSYVDKIFADTEKNYDIKSGKNGYQYYSSKTITPNTLGNSSVGMSLTLQRIENSVFADISNISIPQALKNIPLHLWLVNTQTITAKTNYIDLGLISPYQKSQNIEIQLQDANISLDQYKYVIIINEKDFTIYGQSILGK